MEKLYLGSNKITGPITVDLKLPDSLVDLSIDNNRLTGPLPTGLNLPDSLSFLYLHYNQLTGTIPAAWVTPPLEILSLYGNQLSGETQPAGNPDHCEM